MMAVAVKDSITKGTPRVGLSIQDPQPDPEFGNKGGRFHAGAAAGQRVQEGSPSKGGFGEESGTPHWSGLGKLLIPASGVEEVGQLLLVAEKQHLQEQGGC